MYARTRISTGGEKEYYSPSYHLSNAGIVGEQSEEGFIEAYELPFRHSMNKMKLSVILIDR